MLPSILASLIQSAIAHVYPAYRSYQALQHRRLEDINAWLTYWAVLGVYHTAERIADPFIWWMPVYDECKILLLLWLVTPNGQGASYLYRQYLQPYFAQHEARIEAASTTWTRRITNALGGNITDALSRVNSYLQELARAPIQPGTEFEEIASVSRITEIPKKQE